jgi:basic amino acid/polyamine antiporter, APA family
VPILGAICCGFLAGPWTGRDPKQYVIAGFLVALGVVLWFVIVMVNKSMGVTLAEPAMEDIGGDGPTN